MATRSRLSAAAHAVRARDITLSNLNDALALLEVLRDQVQADAREAQLPGCHYGHAGAAQSLAHDLRKIALRAYLSPGCSEAEAEAMLNTAVAAKAAA